MAGYSGTPLAKKLGMKREHVVRLVNEPGHYIQLFSDLPVNMDISSDKKKLKDLIHLFTKEQKELRKLLPLLKKEMKQDGMIWVSWPKKSAKVETDITEDVIREFALSIGLVDIKVCAVDEMWSGLKLVIPVAMRKG